MNDTTRLAAHREVETEGERTPAQEPWAQAEKLLTARRFELVMRMTPTRFVKLSPVEKRNYKRWAKHFRDVFSEKYSLFERHTPADIDTPTFLLARV